MSNANTGGSAFPLFAATGYSGMTLRDYFAAKAMQAMMTAGYWNWEKPKEDSVRCYIQADEMLKARKA